MSSKNLGPLEEKVMAFVWGRENCTVSQVHSHLKKKRKLAYTTVMTIMARLVEKGFLSRKRQGRAFVYKPQKSRQQAARSMASSVFDRLVNQFGEEAIVAFSDEVKKAYKKQS